MPLTDNDAADLDRIRTSAHYAEALVQLAPTPVVPASASEAALLHALVETGLAAVRHKAESRGYEQITEEQRADLKRRRSEARRRTPSWSNE